MNAMERSVSDLTGKQWEIRCVCVCVGAYSLHPPVCQHYAKQTQTWSFEVHTLTRSLHKNALPESYRSTYGGMSEHHQSTHETADTHWCTIMNGVSNRKRSARAWRRHWFHTTARLTTSLLIVSHPGSCIHIDLVRFGAWGLPQQQRPSSMMRHYHLWLWCQHKQERCSPTHTDKVVGCCSKLAKVFFCLWCRWWGGGGGVGNVQKPHSAWLASSL